MLIRMKHPQNGYHYAYSEQQRDEMRKTGWEVDVKQKPAEVAAEPMPEENVHSMREKLTASGIAFDRRWGLTRLQQALK